MSVTVLWTSLTRGLANGRNRCSVPPSTQSSTEPQCETQCGARPPTKAWTPGPAAGWFQNPATVPVRNHPIMWAGAKGSSEPMIHGRQPGFNRMTCGHRHRQNVVIDHQGRRGRSPPLAPPRPVGPPMRSKQAGPGRASRQPEAPVVSVGTSWSLWQALRRSMTTGSVPTARTRHRRRDRTLTRRFRWWLPFQTRYGRQQPAKNRLGPKRSAPPGTCRRPPTSQPVSDRLSHGSPNGSALTTQANGSVRSAGPFLGLARLPPRRCSTSC